MVRVFLGYHSELIGTRLREMLCDMINVDVTGVVYQGGNLISDLDRTAPDVAILDIRLLLSAKIHDLSGLKLRYPSVRFILLYDYPFSKFSRECLRFGAEYSFDAHHEFASLGSIISQLNRTYRYDAAPHAQ